MPKDIWIKKFKAPELAQVEYNRTKNIYNIFADTQYLSIPRPIEIVENKIYYEKIKPEFVPFRSIINSFNFKGIESIENIFYELGACLFNFHKLLNPNNNLLSTVHIHGDFWGENIFVDLKKKKFLFIDFAVNKLNQAHTTSEKIYYDLARFVFPILFKYPIYKLHYRLRTRNISLVRFFLDGYAKHLKYPLDLETLKDYVISDLRSQAVILKKKNFVSGYFWQRIFECDIKRVESGKYDTMIYNYKTIHLKEKSASDYDLIYRHNSAEANIWREEKAILKNILSGLKVKKYLDFACGTGRIINEVERFAEISHGVDISKEMLKIAEKVLKRSKLFFGDIVENPDFIEDNYDVITAFRFFLNARDRLRRRVLKLLVEKLAPNGYLIFNNHGNKHSLYFFIRRILFLFKGDFFNELSHQQVYDLVNEYGLKIVAYYPVRYFPRAITKYLSFLPDKALIKISDKVKFIRKYAINIIYVCKNEKR